MDEYQQYFIWLTFLSFHGDILSFVYKTMRIQVDNMTRKNRLVTDQDLQEAIERETPVRVFCNDEMVEAGSRMIRFDDRIVVTQSSVSEISHHRRDECEFFEMNS